MDWLMQRRRGVVAALLATLLVINVPARVMTWFLPGEVNLSGLSGTVWSGEAVRSWVMVDGRAVMLGKVQWRISPWRLLWSTPLRVSAEWGDQLLSTRLGVGITGKWIFRDTGIAFHLDALRALMPLYLGGRVTGEFDAIGLSHDSLEEVRGRVNLHNTAWTARSGHIPLGSYRVDVGPGVDRTQLDDPDGREVNSVGVRDIKGVVSTEDGSLVLNGTVTLSGARYSIDLNATGPVARDESFRRAVSVLAIPSATGFEVLISGQL